MTAQVNETEPSPSLPWRARVRRAGHTLVPLWFVATGLVLGIGSVVQDRPLAAACGAVAGVTAGLLYLSRARTYQRQAETLRERLRTQRLESESSAAEMRDRMRALTTEVWELRFAQQVSHMTSVLAAAKAYQPTEKAEIAGLATQPMDLAEMTASPSEQDVTEAAEEKADEAPAAEEQGEGVREPGATSDPDDSAEVIDLRGPAQLHRTA